MAIINHIMKYIHIICAIANFIVGYSIIDTFKDIGTYSMVVNSLIFYVGVFKIMHNWQLSITSFKLFSSSYANILNTYRKDVLGEITDDFNILSSVSANHAKTQMFIIDKYIKTFKYK